MQLYWGSELYCSTCTPAHMQWVHWQFALYSLPCCCCCSRMPNTTDAHSVSVRRRNCDRLLLTTGAPSLYCHESCAHAIFTSIFFFFVFVFILFFFGFYRELHAISRRFLPWSEAAIHNTQATHNRQTVAPACTWDNNDTRIDWITIHQRRNVIFYIGRNVDAQPSTYKTIMNGFYIIIVQ